MLRPSKSLAVRRYGLSRRFHASPTTSTLKQKELPSPIGIKPRSNETAEGQKENLSKRQEEKQIRHGELETSTYESMVYCILICINSQTK
jgi:hypothetical protein